MKSYFIVELSVHKCFISGWDLDAQRDLGRLITWASIWEKFHSTITKRLKAISFLIIAWNFLPTISFPVALNSDNFNFSSVLIKPP